MAGPPASRKLFHIALVSEWTDAQRTGVYTVSTLGRSLAEEGFIHAAYGDQWPAVRERFYGGVGEPLVLLRIDAGRLDVPVIEEAPAPGLVEVFPHIYGPLPVSAVTAAIPLDPVDPNAPAAPAAEPQQTSPAAPSPSSPSERSAQPSFAALYFREMFFNAGLLLLVMTLGFGGMMIGTTFGSDATPALLGVAGTCVGVLLAVGLHRRRKAAGRS